MEASGLRGEFRNSLSRASRFHYGVVLQCMTHSDEQASSRPKTNHIAIFAMPIAKTEPDIFKRSNKKQVNSTMGSCLSKAGIIQPPTVEVTSIQFKSASPLRGISTDVTVTITNPNASTLRAKSFTYRVAKKSDGTQLTEGSGKSFIAQGGNKTTEVVTPVTFSLGGVGAAGKSLLFRGRTNIVVSGSIVFEASLTKEGEVVVPFSGEEVIIVE